VRDIVHTGRLEASPHGRRSGAAATAVAGGGVRYAILTRASPPGGGGLGVGDRVPGNVGPIAFRGRVHPHNAWQALLEAWALLKALAPERRRERPAGRRVDTVGSETIAGEMLFLGRKRFAPTPEHSKVAWADLLEDQHRLLWAPWGRGFPPGVARDTHPPGEQLCRRVWRLRPPVRPGATPRGVVLPGIQPPLVRAGGGGDRLSGP
jgi:hypothetical protein